MSLSDSNTAGDIVVAGLPALLAMKAAALVSRCSEKDLYDLLWLFDAFPERELAELIELGRTVDRGVTGETLVYRIGSTELDRAACGLTNLHQLSTSQRHEASLRKNCFEKAPLAPNCRFETNAYKGRI